MTAVHAVLVDIDGVLTVSWRPLPGAVEAMAALRAAGLKVALLTNTTSRTRACIMSVLRDAGFAVHADEILTAPAVTAAHLASRYPGARCMLLNSGDIRQDMPEVTIVGVGVGDRDGNGEGDGDRDVNGNGDRDGNGDGDGDRDGNGDGDGDREADVVVIGGAGPEFSYQALNRAFASLRRGARLVAMHRSLYWRTDAGLQLDGGAFVAALEQAAGASAEVTGKPSGAFFAAALAGAQVTPGETVMIGDDVEADVLAAQRHGITGVLVRTGKYTPEALRQASGVPDHVIDSFADLPDLLQRIAN